MKLWVDALRSKKYTRNDGICLLKYGEYNVWGVLCDVYSKAEQIPWGHTENGRYTMLDHTCCLPIKILDWLGLSYLDLQFDLEASFEEIGKWLYDKFLWEPGKEVETEFFLTPIRSSLQMHLGVLKENMKKDLDKGYRDTETFFLIGKLWDWTCYGGKFLAIHQVAKELGIKLSDWYAVPYNQIIAQMTILDPVKEEEERKSAVEILDKVYEATILQAAVYPRGGEVRAGLSKVFDKLIYLQMDMGEMRKYGKDERWMVEWLRRFIDTWYESAPIASALWHELRILKRIADE